MQTHSLRVKDARDQLEDLRAELMTFNDVLDVFFTGHADTVVVFCSGRPHPAEWARALQSAGYTIPPRRHAGPASAPLCSENGSSISATERSTRARLDIEPVDAVKPEAARAGTLPRCGNGLRRGRTALRAGRSVYDAA
jgi:hypothetical protein